MSVATVSSRWFNKPATATAARVRGGLLAGCRNQPQLLARRLCHLLRFDGSAIPKRRLNEVVRLKLKPLTGWAVPGYAWKISNGQVFVWYWDESDAVNTAQPNASGLLLCPEALAYPRLPDDGMAIVACHDGYDVVARRHGETWHSRWFAERPNEAELYECMRDAGYSPQHTPFPSLIRGQAERAWPKGWQRQSALIRRIPWQGWALTIGLAFAAALLIHETIAQYRQSDELAREEAALATLTRDKAKSLALSRQIEQQQKWIRDLNGQRIDQQQLPLMQALAGSGLLTGDTVSLSEWNYSAGQLRLSFTIGSGTEQKPFVFNLSDFIRQLEGLHLFNSIELNSDSNPRLVILQTRLKSQSQIASERAETSEADRSDKRPLPADALPTAAKPASRGGR